MTSITLAGYNTIASAAEQIVEQLNEGNQAFNTDGMKAIAYPVPAVPGLGKRRIISAILEEIAINHAASGQVYDHRRGELDLGDDLDVIPGDYFTRTATSVAV